VRWVSGDVRIFVETEMMESSESDRISTCVGEEEAELTGELGRLRSEVERLTSERDQAQGLLREAAAETLSTRTAVAALREAWRASAEHAAIFATDDPQTPDQWRAFGGVENLRACADELDPEKASSFEPCELAKARTAIATMREALISASEFIAEELDNRECAGGEESDYVNDAKCTLALVSDAITLSQHVFPASPISEPRS